MKKILAILAIVAAFGFVSCNKEKPEDNTPDTPEAPAPVADFEYNVDGFNVTFVNKSQNATSYKWNFGDEETSKEENPKHEYAGSGKYTVTLTVANADGVTAKKEADVTLYGTVKAYFSFSTIDGRGGEFGRAIKFDATASTDATSVVWDFGDGESSTEFTPTHIFPGFTKYTVKATVSGEGGASDTYTEEVDVVAKTEMIKGGSMNTDDASYWSVYEYWGQDHSLEDHTAQEGIYCYAPVFGCTDVDLGHGAVYKFESNPLGEEFDNKGAIYQTFDVREGDVFDADCLVKWGEEVMDNGQFFIAVSYDEYSVTDDNRIFSFNNYWGKKNDEWLPAFEGSIAECKEALSGYSSKARGGAEILDGKLRFTAKQTGKLFFIIYINQNQGSAFGAGRDVFVDEVSVNAVVE